MARITKAELKHINENGIEKEINGVKYFLGGGFFQVIFPDNSTFQVCYETESGKINLSDLGEDWGVCGDINKNFSGDILAEIKKHARIFGITIRRY